MGNTNRSDDAKALSLSHYKVVVENSPLFIFKIDKNYRITYANNTFYREFGLKKEDFEGRNARELGYSKEIYNQWYQHFEKVFETGQKTSFETRIDNKGSVRFFNIFVSPEIDELGEVSLITLYMANTTDIKLIEDERDYIFNFSLDMFAIQTIKGDFLKINPSWNEVLNWPSDKLIGTNWLEYVHPEDLYRSKRMQQELEGYNLVVSHETRFKASDGSYVWLEWNSIPIKNKEIVVSVVRNINQWKHINDKLKNSERRYREVVETANYIIFSTDPKGNMLYMNNPGLRITGFKENELKDSNLLTFVEESHRETVKSFYKEMIENKQDTNIIEFPIIDKSGNIIWLMQNAKLKVDNGKPIAIDFIAQDITIRKDSESKLRLNESRLRSIVNSSNEVLIVVDRQGVLKDANDTAYSILNLTENELMERDFREVLKDTASTDLFNTFINHNSNLNTLNGEIRINIKGYKELLFSTKGINYNDGNDHILLFLTNITDIKQAQRVSSVLYNISRAANLSDDLFELYEFVHIQLQSVIEAKNFAIAQIDDKSNKIVFPYYVDEIDSEYQEIDLNDMNSLTNNVIKNKKSLRLNEGEFEKTSIPLDKLHGTSSMSWLGVPLIVNDEIYGVLIVQDYEVSNIYSEEDEVMLNSISEILASTISKLQYQDELEDLNKSLEQRVAERTEQLENTLENLNFENEERKKTQEELQKAQEDLKALLENEKELHKLKSRFISMVSHEYRTPLTVIMSSVNLLKNYVARMTEEQIEKQYKNISASVISMTNLLDDVLMIGKTENLKSISQVEFDIVNSINAIIENIKFVDNGKHIFEVNLPNKLIIKSDKKLLDHAISNIISNSTKYSNKGTKVVLDLNLINETNLNISITDEGIGIPEEDLDRIFESFYRSKNTGAIEGTGLGMSIVKKSIDSLGGTIEISSKLEVGTKVTFTLPVEVIRQISHK